MDKIKLCIYFFISHCTFAALFNVVKSENNVVSFIFTFDYIKLHPKSTMAIFYNDGGGQSVIIFNFENYVFQKKTKVHSEKIA